MEFWLALAIALLLNAAVLVIAYLRQTDKLTDITYAGTFLLLAAVLFAMCAGGTSSLFVLIMVGLWSLRLGLFLGVRIHKIGRDKRFDGVRENFRKFGLFWLGQGFSAWVIMIPVIYILMLMPDEFKGWSAVGLAVFTLGFVVEAAADQQKFAFLNNPKNRGKWIESGLWGYSRHPNYLGEILVWLGVYLFAVPYLSGWQIAIAAVGPLWIAGLLIFVTGIPKTEAGADKKWGKNPAYRAYKKRVPVLIPKKLF